MVSGGEAPERSADPRVRYREQVHVAMAMAMALVLICVALGLIGWSLRPQSTGFPTVPAHIAIFVPRSGITGGEILTRTESNGATLDVLAKGISPAGADPAGEWMVTIENLGAGRLCSPAVYRTPMSSGAVSQFKVLPQRVTHQGNQTIVHGKGDIYLRLCWSSDAPVSLDGSYLSARFPPIGTSLARVDPGTPSSDVDASVTRELRARAGSTANFTIQSLATPTSSTPAAWSWSGQNNTQGSSSRRSTSGARNTSPTRGSSPASPSGSRVPRSSH